MQRMSSPNIERPARSYNIILYIIINQLFVYICMHVSDSIIIYSSMNLAFVALVLLLGWSTHKLCTSDVLQAFTPEVINWLHVVVTVGESLSMHASS